MSRYVLRRLLQAALLLLCIVVVNFTLIHLAPGDPIFVLAGDTGNQTYYDAMRAHFGLDRSIPEQLFSYLVHIAQGDLGSSFHYRQPVMQVILSRLPATLLLMASALLCATALGIWLGAMAGSRAGSATDVGITVSTLLAGAMPAFWVGQLLLIVFAVWLGLFPIQGLTSVRMQYGGWRRVLDVIHHLVLPASTLGLMHIALITRLTRTAVREAFAEDYLRTAHAKGLSDFRIIYRHALSNALLPVTTIVGSHVSTLLAGAVLTEIIFAWPGLGRLFYDATLSRDYPLMMGIVLAVSMIAIAVNLCLDLFYAYLDPRIRFA